MYHPPRIAQERKEGGVPLRSVSLFVRSPWDEEEHGPVESCRALEQLRGCVEELEIVIGNDVLDWNVGDYFFGGLDVRRGQKRYPRADG